MRATLRRRLGAAAAVAGAAVLSVAGIASGDEFDPGNSAPSVSSPSLSAAIVPDSGASNSQYSYAVTVGDADTLEDLSTVSVCLYRTSGGDATCATPDPATDVALTWTRATGVFAVDDGGANDYWANGTAPAPSAPTLSATSGTFTFTFTVSEAMREGGWTATVTATDASAASATDATATTAVAWYGAITARVSQEFGTVAAGATGATGTSTPTVTANGTSTFGLSAGAFGSGGSSFSLASGLPTDVPAAGEVALDCTMGATFVEGSATRVGATETIAGTSQTPTGTPEGGSALASTCRLSHGGGRPIGTYTGTVVNTVGQ